MGKIINIQPVTRIEGHAKVAITLDDAGNVSDTKVHVQALRGFEKFCEGRPVEEMPRIVCHICGICPWAHHLASSTAAPDIAKKVVQMRQMGAQMLEHFAGRAIHPTFSQAGGVSKPMTETERQEVLPLAHELLEISQFSTTLAK